MATYVNDLRLKEIATGDESGTWGTSTNTNLELIANAMGVGAEAIANASTHTITMADGTADEFRSTFLRLTGGGTACTVTLAPNTLSHTWIMRNETAAALTLTQGSGANVVIAAGQTKIVATDGAGSGAIVYEMDDLELAGNLAVDGAITSSSGATITVADNSNNLTLTSTDGDANAGPKLDLYRNSTSPADADLLGRINFRGRNDNSQDVDYAAWMARISDASDGSEDGILRADVIAAGAVVDVLTLYGTEVVVNESSADVDFRVESDANTHALFVQGSDGKVGIGTSAPSALLGLNAAAPDFTMLQSDSVKLRMGVSNTTNGGVTGSASGDFFARTAGGKMLFSTDDGVTSAMSIDANDRVGIGTSAPLSLLDVTLESSGARRFLVNYDDSAITIKGSNGSSNPESLRVVADTFKVNTGTSGSGTEHMRIDSSGKVLIGTSGHSFGERLTVNNKGNAYTAHLFAGSGATAPLIVRNANGASGTRSQIIFYYDASAVGSITSTSSGTALVSSSDQRLKENIADADDSGSKVDAIQVRQFDWKVDGSHQDYGMVAQELQTVAPEAVFGDADSEDMMGVDYSKLVPMLVKEIQSLRTRVQELENN